MHGDQLARVLKDRAYSYRNRRLAPGIVPRLRGLPITEQVVRQVIEPFVTLIGPYLSDETRREVRRKSEEYACKTLARIRSSTHPRHAEDMGFLTQENADVLLTGFVNSICAPLDSALHARDLSDVYL
ncbi:hypothetical protein KGQ25_00010 [Patescibacteria group bacterium]|nr:hypothetical protein [Patescibacteria group bacterium]MDE2021376.1 hypothetical protein [Patescibacteria group bacterium]